VKHFVIHATRMVWNAHHKDKQHNGCQAVGMLPGFDENFDHNDPENNGLHKTFFLSGEVLHMVLQSFRNCTQTPVFESSPGRLGTRRQLILQMQKLHPRPSNARNNSNQACQGCGHQEEIKVHFCCAKGQRRRKWGLARQWVISV